VVQKVRKYPTRMELENILRGLLESTLTQLNKVLRHIYMYIYVYIYIYDVILYSVALVSVHQSARSRIP
jgi:hypothetical protein